MRNPKRHTQLGMALLGGAVTAIDSDIPGLARHCRAVRPTILPAVPRVFERLAANLCDAPPGSLRDAFGGRTRLLVSAGAILPPAVARFFCDAGLPISDSYGL